MNNKLLEHAVKADFLNDEDIIKMANGDIGKSTILFEKTFLRNDLRGDILLFTENKGLIGIEIKTRWDTLRRLKRQLHYYSLVCNYVYVFVYRKKIKPVLRMIHKLNMPYVGILFYDEFQDDIITGIYKKAQHNPNQQAIKLLPIMWRSDLLRTLIANFRQGRYINTYYKSKDISYNQLKQGVQMIFPPINQNPRKFQIIYRWLKIFGKSGSIKLLCLFYIYHDYNDKILNQAEFT